MNFNEAVEFTKQGGMVHRSSWEDKTKYYDRNNFENGLFTFGDINAEDWHEYIKEKDHEEDEMFRTVGELVAYLKTLDQNKPLVAQYIYVLLGNYRGIKERPLLKKLFKEESGIYKINALFY